ncbi:MAG: hypothetical protein QOE73_212, partial [Verrucomicrobiota bacterium]
SSLGTVMRNKVRDGKDAIASTLEACAPQKIG